MDDLDELALNYTRTSDQPYLKAKFLEFVDNQMVGSISSDKLKSVTLLCRSHGDLHGQNILVRNSGYGFKLIDPAECEDLHWASDIARLACDIFISVYDAGLQAHTWERFSNWREAASNFVQGIAITDLVSNENGRAITALEWLRVNLRQLFADSIPTVGPSWEFQLAMAVEFMRAAYRPSAPFPKKVFALVAAQDALMLCEQTVLQLPPTR